MKSKFLVLLLAVGLLGTAVSGAMAQAAPTAVADSAAVKATAPAPVAPAPVAPPPPAPAAKSGPNERIYYGGTVTLGFGTTTRIGIFPMLGFKLTPKLSAGVEVGYEYVSYEDESTNNYGASVFGNYRLGRSLYAHAEYQSINYEVYSFGGDSSREWVPFMLVGGGFYKPISPRTSLYAEVLFDVLQDENSPYDDWEPVVSVGVGVGF